MLFHSTIFLLSFATFFILFWGLARTTSVRVVLLLIASGLFYYASAPFWLPLLVSIVIFHYLLGFALGHPRVERFRLHWLILGISVDLLILSYFKFIRHDVSVSHHRLPLGLSFYLFQCMAYLVDIYRRDETAENNLLNFSTAVSFFPHLPAGPLLRTNNLVTQLKEKIVLRWDDCKEGLFLFALGATKKSIADLLSGLVTTFFTAEAASPSRSWIAALSFTGQIYGDFSGYSDMAIGLSLFLGIRLPRNFYIPFLAPSPGKFWSTHWHLSLAHWVRDYIFIPMAMTCRRMNIPTLVPLTVTMAIMGLWHGSNITYLVFGLYTALIIVLTNLFFSADPRGWRLILQILITNYLIIVGFVIFHAEDLNLSAHLLRLMHTFSGFSPASLDILTLGPLFLGLSALFLLSLLDSVFFDWINKRPGIFWGLVVLLVYAALLMAEPRQTFIYFQF